jgi:hypothetical protein
MARKKDKKIMAKEKAGIVYSGQVSVAIRSGNKTLSKKTYHNTGGVALFKFLANCIKDGGGQSSSLLPIKIKLFEVDTDKKAAPGDIISELSKTENYGESVDLEEKSIDISSASTFTAKSDTANVASDGKSVTLSFKVPYSYITKTKINMIALYGRGITHTGYWSAYYLLTQKNTDNTVSWDDLEINSSQNYNLLIEWKMSFDNSSN